MNERQLAELDRQATADKLSKNQSEGNYTTEETRVHNKRMAPTGHIFLVVKSSGKGFKCSNHMSVPFGLTAEQKQEVHEMLYAQLQTKYGV